MSTSANEIERPMATSVDVSEDTLIVELIDGRTISVPISWYPRLANASLDELQFWELIGNGDGIHWESLDEDISVQALLAGKRSNESQDSLRSWLSNRNT